MTISVIVPVYNTEKFLKECLKSIINQTFKDLEIICVNDGSTDNSLKILNEFKNRDFRIKIITKENAGLSAARNTGVEAATGEYIAFIDSDDTVDLNFFEKLYNAIVKNNSDISAASILRTRKNLNKIRVKYDREETFKTLEDKINACNIPKCCYVWNKLYKSELVKKVKFKEGAYYEDILWTPVVLKEASSLTTVCGTNYYYRANSLSTVKKPQSLKKQLDSYNAKKFLIDFFKKNNLPLTKKQKTVTKRLFYLGNFVILKIKEFADTEIFCLFGCIPVFKKKIKAPVIKDNTFIVWEACSKSHSEVVPGYVKYLLDLGYHVSVIVHPDRYKEGLFSGFSKKELDETRLSLNKMTRKEAKAFFKSNSLENVKGVLVTTAGKICDCVHYNMAYDTFSPHFDRKKLFLVEHEASFASDKGMWKKDLITLRALNYNNETSVVVNPHYFGNFPPSKKNEITNFITIGAIKPNKKNANMIVDAVQSLVDKGYTNFKVTVVGKGSLKHVPPEIRKYFCPKGRLSFKKMYEEIQKADFFLMPYNENDPEHIRYNTSGTSGNFQLIYGFLKPCVLVKSFAPINGFTCENALLYDKDEDFPLAMERGINMGISEYSNMRSALKSLEERVYTIALENLKNLILTGANYE